MSANQAGPLRKAWFFWKSLHLPWRNRIFVGQDIKGNTYYELRLPRGDDNPDTVPHRRLVYYPRSTHLSEVKVPPAWHQWLRYQRELPPSMEEQVAELQRQTRIKILAAEADARWEAKPSLLDMPPTETKTETKTETTATDEAVSHNNNNSKPEPAAGSAGKIEEAQARKKEDTPATQTDPEAPSLENDPWRRAERGAPGETWQPEAWTPTSAKKR